MHTVPLCEKHLCKVNQVSNNLLHFSVPVTSDTSGIFFVKLLDRIKFHKQEVQNADAKNNAEIFIPVTILIFLLPHTSHFHVSLYFGFHNTFQPQGL